MDNTTSELKKQLKSMATALPTLIDECETMFDELYDRDESGNKSNLNITQVQKMKDSFMAYQTLFTTFLELLPNMKIINKEEYEVLLNEKIQYIEFVYNPMYEQDNEEAVGKNGGSKKRKIVYVKVARKYRDKEGKERVLYKKGANYYVKRKSEKTGKFTYRKVNV